MTKYGNHKVKFPIPLEDAEQLVVVDYLRLRKVRFHASPNGGKRAMKTAVAMKRQGCSPGFPDLIIFPAGKEPIAIEMKRRKGGRTSEEQNEWLEFFDGQGWSTMIAHGADEALQFLKSCGI